MAKMYKLSLLLSCALLVISCADDEKQVQNVNDEQKTAFVNVTDYKVLSEPDVAYPRKFSLATFIDNNSNINCWEQSLAELGESQLHCSFEFTNGEIRTNSFKTDGIRYVPAGFVNIDSELQLIVTVISKDAFSCYDSSSQEFFCLNAKKYSSIASFSIDSKSGNISKKIDFYNHELFYGAYMQPYISDEYTVIPFWERDNKATAINETSIGYLTITNDVTVTYFKEEHIADYVEPSFTVLNDVFYMSFRSLKGEYVYLSKSYDKGTTWGLIEASSIFSPSSMNKIFTLNNKIIGVIHNNYKTAAQGHRNTLDITYVDENFNIMETVNLLSDENDYYSNFGFFISNNLSIAIQELDRAREVGPALDRVVSLTVTE
ncbi:MAG: hypothetical protein COB48_06380 [Pseudoalteromonas sp.]|nr:MAG: hypothetical protein COB48_06380 [Pseudoalteromonas sp.]